MIGETFATKYTVTRLLGQGGMGAVFEARHTGTGRRVAIKVISATAASDPRLLSRFEIEARATGEIESQHIAHVLDVGVDAARGTPYLVMEFLAGEDLQHIMDRVGPFRPELAARIVSQACLGLHKAHEARIIHRDIKPANIFVTERDDGDLVVKLVDFGIAKILGDEGPQNNSLTRTGTLMGSPLYMSPEQARGRREIDHRSDLWSLGVVLYQALAGRTPFHDINALGDLIISISTEAPPSVLTLAPWVPPDLAAVVDKALRIQIADRFQSAMELLGALQPFTAETTSIRASMLVALDERERSTRPPALARSAEQFATSHPSAPPAAAAPAVAGAGATTHATSIESMTSTRGASASRPRSSRAAWVAGGLGAALVLGGGAFFGLRRAEPASKAPAAAASAPSAPEVQGVPTAIAQPITPVTVTPGESPAPTASATASAPSLGQRAQPARTAHAAAPKASATAAPKGAPAGAGADPFGGIRQ